MKRLILLSVLVLLCLPAFAQEEKRDTVLPKGTISGRVLSEEGMPVPDADVFVYNVDDIIGSSTSDSAGNYLTNRMFPGTYRVWVKCKGYIRKSIDNIEVKVWQDTKLDIKLSLFKTDTGNKVDTTKVISIPYNAEKR